MRRERKFTEKVQCRFIFLDPNPKVPFLKHLLLATCTMGGDDWGLGGTLLAHRHVVSVVLSLDKTTRRQDIIFNYKGAVHKHTSKCRHIYTYLYSDIVEMGS